MDYFEMELNPFLEEDSEFELKFFFGDCTIYTQCLSITHVEFVYFYMYEYT